MASRLFQCSAEKSVCFFVSVATSSGHFVPKSGVGLETGRSYTPCPLMKSALCLQLHAVIE